MTTKTLDLGCGARPKNPFAADEMFGVDIRDGLGDHVRKADLVIEPIPYEDNAFDYLTAYDFIEHVPRVIYAPQRRNAFVEFMNEAYRVLKPGGYFLSSTPAFPYAIAFRDPTHVNIITDETFPDYFDDEKRWSAMYGFNGAFHVVRHEWRGPYLYAVLRKVPVKPDADAPVVPNDRISVVLPVRDDAPRLAQTLESLCRQTHVDLEIVCIDDCSTDGSLALLLEHAERDKRIRVLQTLRRGGTPASVLQLGVSAIDGGFCLAAAPGDSFLPDCLEKMHARATATNADAVLPDTVPGPRAVADAVTSPGGLNGDRNAELTGRDALACALDGRLACHALVRSTLVKFFGFADQGAQTALHATRVFLLNARKVVFSDGSVSARPADASGEGFDDPCVQLRLFQLLHAESFPAEIVQREALKAVAQRNALQHLLADPARLSPDQRDAARACLDRCSASMKRDPMFAQVV